MNNLYSGHGKGRSAFLDLSLHSSEMGNYLRDRLGHVHWRDYGGQI